MERIVNIIPSANALCLAFDNEEQFTKWASTLSLDVLKYWISEFEKEEIYELCAILKDFADNKEQTMVHFYNGL